MNRLELARQLRASTDVHYNCCQSVLIPFAKEMGLTEEQAFALGANFNGGMRCGSVCGTLTGALMVLGASGHEPGEADAFRNKFRDTHGDINCAVLLKNSHDRGIPRKEHCDNLVYEIIAALEEIIGTP